MEFKDRLGALRRAKHFNQSELAEAAGVSVDTLKRWEGGKQLPRLDELIGLSSALELTVGMLIGEEAMPELPKEEPRPIPSSQPKRKNDPGKIVVQVGSLKVEVPATPEGYAFVGEKLGNFKIEEVPQQSFVKTLQVEEE